MIIQDHECRQHTPAAAIRCQRLVNTCLLRPEYVFFHSSLAEETEYIRIACSIYTQTS